MCIICMQKLGKILHFEKINYYCVQCIALWWTIENENECLLIAQTCYSSIVHMPSCSTRIPITDENGSSFNGRKCPIVQITYENTCLLLPDRERQYGQRVIPVKVTGSTEFLPRLTGGAPGQVASTPAHCSSPSARAPRAEHAQVVSIQNHVT
jgi:hypothetical protein